MGLIEDLGYAVKPVNGVQRLMQKIAASKPGAWLFSKTLHFQDKVLFKLSGGRLTIPTLLAGLPVVMLTTTGAKSGTARTMPLLAIPNDGDLAVIGSNFGQGATPGWVYNLEARPDATVEYRGTAVEAVARRADATETDRAFEAAAAVYPGYAKYRERATHREIRVFVLSAARVTDGPRAS